MRERGLKLKLSPEKTAALGRSREGAWIEICMMRPPSTRSAVAPVRERGLKFVYRLFHRPIFSRSREGAWIEIVAAQSGEQAAPVAPVRERGLKWCFHLNKQRPARSLP